MQIENPSEIPFFNSIEFRIFHHEFRGNNPPDSILVVLKWGDKARETRVYRFNNTIIGFKIPYPTSEWLYNPPHEIQIGGSQYSLGNDGVYRR
jgi:hypothetical protein